MTQTVSPVKHDNAFDGIDTLDVQDPWFDPELRLLSVQ